MIPITAFLCSRYFGLPNQVRWSIWDGTELLRQPLRPQFFGDGNFVISMKDAVTVWVRDRFKADVSLVPPLIGNGDQRQTDPRLLCPLWYDIRPNRTRPYSIQLVPLTRPVLPRVF